MIKNPFTPIPDNLFSPVSKPAPLTPSQSTESNIILCEVQDVIAYGHSYIVKGNNTPRMVAALGSSSGSMTPIGARDISMLEPGALVLVWYSKYATPVILCAVPLPQGSNRVGLPDVITPVGNAGLFADPAHQFVASNAHGQGVLDLSAGRPVDNLPGDWGHLNELGVGFILGKLMSSVKATDLSKLDFFYLDNLVRLFSYNWQHYTAGSSVEGFNDEGEWTSIEEYTPFAWEASPELEATPKEELSLFGSKFGYEPSNPLNAPLSRLKEFKGYLGDLYRRMVLIPKVTQASYGTAEDGKYPKEDEQTYFGALDEIIGVDGSYALRSAKSILFEKSVWIPVPEQLMPRDHPEGDQDFDTPGGESLQAYPLKASPSDIALNANDKTNYDRIKYLSQGFNSHKKDWKVNDDAKVLGGFTEETGGLAPYSGFEHPRPSSASEAVDHRKSGEYFQGKAKIQITDDGGILLEDAYGSSIKLVGGNIEISCPGNIITRSGKSIQNWAGKDFIVKANNSVEITASNDDVRVKAERNLLMLGGNSGQGGTLIEDRSSTAPNYTGEAASTNAGGLTLKSSRGKLNVLGDGVHIRSEGAALVLDGEDGDQDIVSFSRNTQNYARRAITDVIANKEEMETTPANEVSMAMLTRSNYTLSTGTMKFGASNLTMVNHRSNNPSMNINIKGNLTLEGRGSATGNFGKIPSQSVFGQEAQIHTQLIDSVLEDQLAVSADLFLRSSTALPNTAINMGFFYARSDELALGSMLIYEAPWQKAMRDGLGIKADEDLESKVSVYEEQEVLPRIDKDTNQGAGDPTMPFPGFTAWTHQNRDRTEVVNSSDAFARRDEIFSETSATGSRPKKIGDDIDKSYDLGLINETAKGKFEGNYIVNS